MDLAKLLSRVPALSVTPGTNREMNPDIEWLDYDSRRIRPQSIFFAVQGDNADGHSFLEAALENGAVAVASERPAPTGFPTPWIRTSEVRSYMALMANEFHGRPSEQMELIGVTGTNGKTTTSYLIHSILERGGPSLLMGTIKTVIGAQAWESERTTPEAIDIQRVLAEAWRAGCQTGVLEVSSHALWYRRVYDCRFPVAVFTNLTQDHLDFHGSMEEYFQAKRLLFQTSFNPGIRHAVLNGDDPYSQRVAPSPGVAVTRFGFSADCDVHPLESSVSVAGTILKLRFFDRELTVTSRLVGRHNGYNLMAAAAACARAGIPDSQIVEGLERLGAVPGRFERVETDTPFSVFVDYAHTPDALANVLRLARSVCQGRLICVFGCGGDRDRSKRPKMGKVAVESADLAVVTSDNPRSEPPERIIDEILAGMPAGAVNWESIVSRRAAIARAVALAGPGDLVLLAGKGHETYQEIEGRKIHFDDRRVVREVL